MLDEVQEDTIENHRQLDHSTTKTVEILEDTDCDSTTEYQCSIETVSVDSSTIDSEPRRVRFLEDLVTEQYETPCWSPEEKACLFYTGKELHQFRIEHIIELYESQDAMKMDEWSKFEGRRSLRILWSCYAFVFDFFTCQTLTQCCCGREPSLKESQAQPRR